ncbi:MAG TPA: hypothetical protein PLL26_05915 [Candidatus Dojkabacteria bacterium]|nr:hypothetical protein [Candidatus Dojkabacteria bacterium]
METSEAFEKFQREKKYREEYEEYKLLNKQKNEIEARMDKIKERVAAMLHEDKINEKIVELSNGEKWKGAYQTTSRTVTDLKMLMEIVGPGKYSEIVSQKETIFLTIRKAGKEKKDTLLTSTKPIEDNNVKPFVPTGTVLS